MANWTREQRLVALRLYCRTPYGKLNQSNRDIEQLANLIGRSHSALVMKACNFASLDPAKAARGVKGLKGVAEDDKQIWREFQDNPEAIANEAEAAWESLTVTPEHTSPTRQRGTQPTDHSESLAGASGWSDMPVPTGPTDTERLVRVRRVQGFFRDAVLVSYHSRCALTGIAVPELLIASHIIPWSVDEARRADPSNGICLNALYDRAFDRGLLTFDEDLRAVLSDRLRIENPPRLHARLLLEIAGTALQLPDRFRPDPGALEYHRECVFQAG